MATSNYDIIANEYYDSRHITSRNFDDATREFCSKTELLIPDSGLVLELGTGRGNARNYCRIESSRLIQSDLSWNMLTLSPREECLARIQFDALSLPFAKYSFAAILAFLYDPYNQTAFYHNVEASLRKGGVFFGTLPHFTWGKTLRKEIKLNNNKTRFRLFNSSIEEYVELESLLMDDTNLTKSIESSGLEIIHLSDVFLPTHVDNISPHIKIPAKALQISPYNLPILKAILARRKNE